MDWLQTFDLKSQSAYLPFEAMVCVTLNYSGSKRIPHYYATNLIEAQGDYSAPKEGMISAKIRFASEKAS